MMAGYDDIGQEKIIKAFQFYDEVKKLTDKAFHLDKTEIDFVNAEDLEVLLKKYNPAGEEDNVRY